MKLKNHQKQALYKYFPALTIAVTISLLPSNYISNDAIAQPDSFSQPSTFDEQIVVNVDLSETAVEYFGVIIHNDITGVEAIEFYSDDGTYPRQISIPGHIHASLGDPLTTCVMNMITEEIACDTQIADFDGMKTEFNLDIDYAQSVSSQPYDQFDENDVQRYANECSCNVCNTAFSGSENSADKIRQIQMIEPDDTTGEPGSCPE